MADVKWIKLATDIFDNRKIRQIEKMPEGDSIIVVWLKLLCLAGTVNDGGVVYLTRDVPYTEDMLATQFDRPISIVKLALRVFEQFGMIELVDDMIMLTSWEKYQSLEKLELMREQNRLRKQNERERKRLQIESSCHGDSHADVTQCHATDIDKDIDIEEDKEKRIKRKKTSSLSDFEKAIEDFKDFRKKIKAPLTDRAVDLLMTKLKTLAGDNEEAKIAILNQSIMNGWKGVFALKETTASGFVYNDQYEEGTSL